MNEMEHRIRSDSTFLDMLRKKSYRYKIKNIETRESNFFFYVKGL